VSDFWEEAMRTRDLLVLAASASLGLCLLATPAIPAGSEAGTPPRRAPSGGPAVTLAAQAFAPSVVVDRTGNATAVWAGNWRNGRIWTARRPAGGSWRAPVAVGWGADPKIGVQGNGAVTVAYITTRDGRTDGVSVVNRPPGGRWSTPRHLTQDRAAPGYQGPDGEGVYGATNLELAVNNRGAGVVTWVWGSFDRVVPYRIQGAYRPADGRWGTTAQLSSRRTGSLYYHLEVGIDRADRVTLVWSVSEPSTLVVKRRVVGRGWTAPARPARRVREWDLAVDPAGDATILMTRTIKGACNVDVMVRRAAGSWSTPIRVGVEGGQYTRPNPEVVVDTGGTVSAVWGRDYTDVRYLRHRLGDQWRKPVTIAGPLELWGSDVAVNQRGDVVAVWQSGARPMTGRYRDQGSGWTPAFPMVKNGEPRPDGYGVAVGPSGLVFLVWAPEGTGPLKARVFQ
jgi:hypothetical protein